MTGRSSRPRLLGALVVALGALGASPAFAGEPTDAPAPAPTGASPPAPVPAPASAPREPSKGGAGPTRSLDAYELEWRRHTTNKKNAMPKWFEPTHFLLGLRFAPYFPEVDDEFGGGATPYADVFGKKGLFYFGLSLDWLPIRVPYVGALGLGMGWGWTHASATAKISGTTTESGTKTGLTIMPMNASGTLLFDGMLRELDVPVVPYARIGFGFASWSASGGSGTSSADGVSGEGLSPGLHLALGGAIALNAFDSSSESSLKEQVGISNIFLYGEWMRDMLDGVGSTAVMQVGTSTGVVGLSLDF